MPSCPRILHAVLSLCTVLLIGGGCASYEYDIVEPPDVAQHVAAKQSVVVPMDPLRYEARASSDRLVLFIHNESDEPVKLLGEDSYAVDSRGESHPLPTRTIAAGSSTKLIFPPVQPTFRQSGPTIGVGVGVYGANYGRRGYYGGRYGYDPFYDDTYPRYYRLEDDGTTYWDWGGNGTSVRVRLVYQRGSTDRFHHDFTFRRVKV
jgi:hypothetical protein